MPVNPLMDTGLGSVKPKTQCSVNDLQRHTRMNVSHCSGRLTEQKANPSLSLYSYFPVYQQRTSNLYMFTQSVRRALPAPARTDTNACFRHGGDFPLAFIVFI